MQFTLSTMACTSKTETFPTFQYFYIDIRYLVTYSQHQNASQLTTRLYTHPGRPPPTATREQKFDTTIRTKMMVLNVFTNPYLTIQCIDRKCFAQISCCAHVCTNLYEVVVFIDYFKATVDVKCFEKSLTQHLSINSSNRKST